MQIDREGEEKLKQQGIPTLGKCLWDYPKYDTSKVTLREWEGTKRFHDQMWDMQKIYEDKIWQFFKEKEKGFTHWSQFKRSIDELLEELQALTFSKVCDNGRV